MLYREAEGFFDGTHNEHGLDGADGIGGAQHVHDELLVGAHIGAVDLEQVIKFAGDVVALGHFFHVAGGLLKAVGGIAGHFTQFDAAEYHESQIQFLGVQHCYILLYIALALQTFLALEYRGGGQVYLGG